MVNSGYKYDVTLLYTPFSYSSDFIFHDLEHETLGVKLENFQQVSLLNVDEVNSFSPFPIAYACPYFPESPWEIHLMGNPSWLYSDINWQDPGFRQLVKKIIAPKSQCRLTIPSKETINIAIHFRDGGTYDKVNVKKNASFLTKFPPLEFYIEGLLKIIALFPEQPLYCYLFTDADRPIKILKKIKKEIPYNVPITFDCRTTGNTHNKNVLEDFFSLFEFDVLIHPQSNFSIIPALIHDFAVTYSPLSGNFVRGRLKIDNVKFTIDEKLCQELLTRTKLKCS